ncbi:MAG: GNAT family N-acetyltransferase [Alphaproteobacteria bacterium]|nr:GNAT family N-acetyltransferase [Alphaproteobacteria bacterium]
MSAQPAVSLTRPQVVMETPNFYIRRLSPDDASERIGSWFAQSEVAEGLNAEQRPLSRDEVRNWLASFDQQANRVNGIFDKRNDLLVAIANSQFNWDIRRVLMNIVVGEEAYRHCGVILEACVPVRDLYFEDMKLSLVTGTALSTNRTIIAFLEGTGFTRRETVKNHRLLRRTGAYADLHLYSQTAQEWRDWKAASQETIAAIRDCAARLPPA